MTIMLGWTNDKIKLTCQIKPTSVNKNSLMGPVYESPYEDLSLSNYTFCVQKVCSSKEQCTFQNWICVQFSPLDVLCTKQLQNKVSPVPSQCLHMLLFLRTKSDGYCETLRCSKLGTIRQNSRIQQRNQYMLNCHTLNTLYAAFS